MKQSALLHQVLGPAGIEITFQPILDVSTDPFRIVALEALARGPVGTNLRSAPVLFDFARAKGREVDVDRACIRQAFKALASIATDLPVTVNANASSLSQDSTFADFVLEEAAASGLPPERLVVEVVEQNPSFGDLRLSRSIARLQGAGVRVAIDDFGEAHSGFRWLVNCRPEIVKVASFLAVGIEADPHRQAVLRHLIRLSSELGTELVIEGVETEAQLAVLQELGVHLAQGWLLCKPLPASLWKAVLACDPEYVLPFSLASGHGETPGRLDNGPKPN